MGPDAWLLQSWDLTDGYAQTVRWKQCLRDTRANCQHTHRCSRAESSATNSVICEPARGVKSDTTEHTHRWTALGEEQLQWLPFQRECSVPPTSHHRRETWLRYRSGSLYSNHWGADPTSKRAATITQQRGGPAQVLVQALATTLSIPLLSRGWRSAYMEKRGGRHPLQKQPSH